MEPDFHGLRYRAPEDQWSEAEITLAGDGRSCMVIKVDTGRVCGEEKAGVLGAEIHGRSISMPVCRKHLEAATTRMTGFSILETSP